MVELRKAREQLARLNEEVQAGLVSELSRLPAHYGYSEVADFAQAVRAAIREVEGSPRRRRRRKPAPAPIAAPTVHVSVAPAPVSAPLPAPEEMPPSLPADSGDSFAFRDVLTAQREEALRRLNDRATKPQAWIAWKKHLAAVDDALRASQ